MTSWSRETPWRQGHLLRPETVEMLGLACGTSPEKVAAVVVTHDCDLAQHPGAEPLVEIVLGLVLEGAPSGNYTNCKNLRRLHVGYTAASEAIHVELEASRRVFVRKEDAESPQKGLAGHEPSVIYGMTPRERNTLQLWLSARYRRAAFPDEFDRRLKDETKIAEKLAKAFKDSGYFITAVFFDVDSGAERIRDGAGDPYELIVTLLYSTENDPQAALEVAEQVAADIREIFKGRCRGLVGGVEAWRWIELVDIEVISDEALTYAQSLQLKKWQADHISLRQEPEHPLLTS